MCPLEPYREPASGIERVGAAYLLRLRVLQCTQKVKAVALKRFAFDRTCEIEADEYAAKLLKDNRTDPSSLVVYLRTLPPEPSNPMSVYPTPSERIDSAQRAIAALRR